MNQPTLWEPNNPANSYGGKVGYNYPQTSKRAARTVKTGTQKDQIIRRIANDPNRNMTAYQLAGKILNKAGEPISKNQIATRLLELRESGHVEYLVGAEGIEERTTTGGNSAQVQQLTVKGWEVYERNINR